MIQHKGYFGNAVFDDQADVFHGEVLGIRDVVTFQGQSVEDLRRAFEQSIDDYLEFCRERGEEPDRAPPGHLVLDVPPSLHRQISAAAELAGQDVNVWILSQLEHSATCSLNQVAAGDSAPRR
jgi:predicted HicB family RNase H-like nuclease